MTNASVQRASTAAPGHGREEVLDRATGEPVAGLAGQVAADRRRGREQHGVDRERVGRHRHDRADLVADQRADRDADQRAHHGGDRGAERERQHVAARQRHAGAAHGEDRAAGGERDRDAGDGEQHPDERGRGELGAEDHAPARLHEQRRPDRAVAELAGDGDEPGERREQDGRDAGAEHRALRLPRRELGRRRRQALDARAEQGQRRGCEQQRRHRAGGPQLEQLGAQLPAHARGSAVSSRNTSSRDGDWVTSCRTSTSAARAIGAHLRRGRPVDEQRAVRALAGPEPGVAEGQLERGGPVDLDPHRPGEPVGELAQRRLGDQPPVVDDHHPVDRLRDLGEVVARDEHGPALRREGRAGSRAASARPRDRARWRARRGSGARGRRAGRRRAPVAGACPASSPPRGDRRRRVSSTSASTSATRPGGTPAARASTRRWSRPVRPGWRSAASSTAPTRRAGRSSSANGRPNTSPARWWARRAPAACAAWWSCPAPFGPRKPVTVPGLELERQVVDGRELAEALGQRDCGQDRGHAAQSTMRRRDSVPNSSAMRWAVVSRGRSVTAT